MLHSVGVIKREEAEQGKSDQARWEEVAVLQRVVGAGLMEKLQCRNGQVLCGQGRRAPLCLSRISFSWAAPAKGSFSNIGNFWFQMFRMLLFLLLLWFLPPTEGSQHAEPMFTAVTNSVLPPDYDSNPTQLNYGVAVTDVDHDGDFEIVVAG